MAVRMVATIFLIELFSMIAILNGNIAGLKTRVGDLHTTFLQGRFASKTAALAQSRPGSCTPVLTVFRFTDS
jgi:hypothetical protein